MSLLTRQSKFKLFWFLTQGNKLQSNTNCKNIQHYNSVSWNLSLQSSLVSVFISTNKIPPSPHTRWISIRKQFCPGVLLYLHSHLISWSVFPLPHPSETKSPDCCQYVSDICLQQTLLNDLFENKTLHVRNKIRGSYQLTAKSCTFKMLLSWYCPGFRGWVWSLACSKYGVPSASTGNSESCRKPQLLILRNAA